MDRVKVSIPLGLTKQRGSTSSRSSAATGACVGQFNRTATYRCWSAEHACTWESGIARPALSEADRMEPQEYRPLQLQQWQSEVREMRGSRTQQGSQVHISTFRLMSTRQAYIVQGICAAHHVGPWQSWQIFIFILVSLQSTYKSFAFY